MKKALSLFLSLTCMTSLQSALPSNMNRLETLNLIESYLQMFNEKDFTNDAARRMLPTHSVHIGLFATGKHWPLEQMLIQRKNIRTMYLQKTCKDLHDTEDKGWFFVWQTRASQLYPKNPSFCPLYTQRKIGFIADLYNLYRSTYNSDRFLFKLEYLQNFHSNIKDLQKTLPQNSNHSVISDLLSQVDTDLNDLNEKLNAHANS